MRTLLWGLALAGLLGVRPAMAEEALPQPAGPPPTKPLSDFITHTLPDGRVLFRLFAPQAHAVSLIFGNADRRGRPRQGLWRRPRTASEPHPRPARAQPLRILFRCRRAARDRHRDEHAQAAARGEHQPGSRARQPAGRAAGPHGELRSVTYHSKALGAERQMYVYTPPATPIPPRRCRFSIFITATATPPAPGSTRAARRRSSTT